MFTIALLKEILGSSATFTGAEGGAYIGFKPLGEAQGEDITWIRPQATPQPGAVNGTAAGCIVCDAATHGAYTGSAEKLFILTSNPQAAFSRLLYHYEQTQFGYEGPAIHPTAIVHKDAKLGAGVRIGAYSVIDACTIGGGTVVGEYVRIFKPVTIGRNCLVREHCSIGGAGFGIYKNAEGRNTHMPHIGSVVIEDSVLVFPYTNIDRGTLGVTRIGANTCIDHYCHIGHNTTSGENNIITAGTVLCGSSHMGNDNWIGVGTIVREKNNIGSGTTTGLGAIVVKPIPDGETWVGNPAREISSIRKA